MCDDDEPKTMGGNCMMYLSSTLFFFQIYKGHMHVYSMLRAGGGGGGGGGGATIYYSRNPTHPTATTTTLEKE